MFKKTLLIHKITSNLAFISKTAHLESSIGLHDNKRAAQEFYKEFLNIIFGYNLKNLDQLNNTSTYPAIDLGDDQLRLAIQVTTTKNSTKIKETIDKFIKFNLHENYGRLVILIIGDKQGYTTSFDTQGKFNFDESQDIWDDRHLTQQINTLDINDLKAVSEFLESTLEKYQFPDRLFDHDIKECIRILKREICDTEVEVKDGALNIESRDDEYLGKKNNLNNITWDSYKEKIQRHVVMYNGNIIAFLKDPINRALQEDYFLITQSINQLCLKEKKDCIFEEIFKKISSRYSDTCDHNKLKILLHNMYFNCDIGVNP
jgi:hypothetical protein